MFFILTLWDINIQPYFRIATAAYSRGILDTRNLSTSKTNIILRCFKLQIHVALQSLLFKITNLYGNLVAEIIDGKLIF